MQTLLPVSKLLAALNGFVLAIALRLGAFALALMVLIILAQVFFRYVLNNALPWPDEAARFCMLWMTGLMAPAAYRMGGFVSIDMALRKLPRIPTIIATLVLLAIALTVLLVGFELSLKHVKSGWLFKSSSLKFATAEGQWRMPLAYMFMSLQVGIVLMISVNIELMLRSVITLLGGEDRLPAIASAQIGSAD